MLKVEPREGCGSRDIPRTVPSVPQGLAFWNPTRMPDLPTLLLRHRVSWGSLWPFGNWERLPGCSHPSDGLSLCSHCLAGKQEGPLPLTSSGKSLLSFAMAPMYPQHPWDLNQQIRQIQSHNPGISQLSLPCVANYPSSFPSNSSFSILSLLITLHCPFFAISPSISLFLLIFFLCLLHGRFP